MAESLLKVLMYRDDLSIDDAQEIIDDLKQQVRDGEDPEELLFDIGLEPDYIFDIL